MLRVLGVLLLASTALLPAAASSTGTVAAATPVHTLEVSGAGVVLYPAFEPGIERLAMTTTAATGGTVRVTAATSDPEGTVTVDGRPVADGTVTVTGLGEGDEVPVVFEDSGGREVHALVHLPAGFPRLTTSVDTPGVSDGDLLVNLSRYDDSGTPNFEAAVDRHGVPSYVRSFPASKRSGDLKPTGFGGHYTVFRTPTSTPGRSGGQVVELDSGFSEVRRLETVGLQHTDSHDSLLREDGSRILLAYEPDEATGLQDAVIQEIDPSGAVVYTWNSADHLSPSAETTRPNHPDYAHINSIEVMADGDILASFRHFSSVYKIAWSDRDGVARGDVVWRLGGRSSDFSFPNDVTGTGPCAQHSATQLDNGHILLFDNGSAPLLDDPSHCVDQANPGGPTVKRQQTRVTEYALDVAAGTATQVWTYEVPGWFAYFAGSARRLDGGNTLIGWAAERRALASEVDPEGRLVWELKSADGYLSYRAFKAVVPDTLDPTVEVSGPADGATYTVGARVPTVVRCRDRGGSSLQTCDAPQVLDTATAGEHIWTVTGTDGAGNVTTVERSYTVVTAVAYRPDAMIKGPGASWTGNNVYGGYRRQRISQTLEKAGAVRTAVLRLQSEANRAERLRVSGTVGSDRFRVRYFADGADVTGKVVDGTLRTPVLDPGRYLDLTVRVTRTGAARPGDARTVSVLAVSAHEPARRDSVATTVRATR